jgi:hypothetical protein
MKIVKKKVRGMTIDLDSGRHDIQVVFLYGSTVSFLNIFLGEIMFFIACSIL